MTSLSDNNWWDGRNPESFFPTVYMSGNDSIEGNLDEQSLTIEQRTIRECDMVESILKLSQGSKILDCPCGYGRHSIELARRGFDLTGVDLCPQFIAEARKNAHCLPSEALCLLFEGDMRFLPTSLSNFDTILNMFLSFGFFDDSNNFKVLKEYHRVLHPKGKLLIHTDVNPDRVNIDCYRDRPIRNLRNGCRLKIEENFDFQTGTLRGTWTLERNHIMMTSRSYAIQIYTHNEMIGLLKATGFSTVEILFPWHMPEKTGKPPQEVIYVASK